METPGKYKVKLLHGQDVVVRTHRICGRPFVSFPPFGKTAVAVAKATIPSSRPTNPFCSSALVGCNMLWGMNVCDDDLMALGANIGEDVPFFIKGMMALGLGHKKPLMSLQTSKYVWNWVLGVPAAGLSTKSLFERFDHTLARSPSPSAEEIYLKNRQNCIELPWGTCHPEELLSALVNDFEGPSTQLLSDIQIALRAGKTAGAVASLMCGSGSTCAFLARDETHARSLMIELQKETVFKVVLMASGPVEGVRVLQYMR